MAYVYAGELEVRPPQGRIQKSAVVGKPLATQWEAVRVRGALKPVRLLLRLDILGEQSHTHLECLLKSAWSCFKERWIC